MILPKHWIVSSQDRTEAMATVLRAEQDLGRTLDAGQRRDLLADNFCVWSTDYIRLVVDAIEHTDPNRRCDSNLCGAGGECIACGAIQGEACRKPEGK